METVRCVWWNVENLFPFDPQAPTADYRPKSEPEYQSKLQALAAVLRGMPQGPPDLLMVCEVADPSRAGNRDAAKDLAIALGGDWERLPAQEGDTRGIACAAMWRPNIIEKVDHRIHPVTEDLLGTERGRPIVELALRHVASGRGFSAFMNHWKSRGGDSRETEAKRMAAGKQLIALVQALVSTTDSPDADPNALVLAVGDFNDEPYNMSLTDPTWENKHLFVTRDRAQVLDRAPHRPLPVLYNPCWRLLGQMQGYCGAPVGTPIPAGSYRYDGVSPSSWATFDQVLVTAGMLRGQTPVLDEASLQAYCRKSLLAADGRPSSPSDHLPLCWNLRFA